jgi:zinc/manganese transport system substrate-binding protein
MKLKTVSHLSRWIFVLLPVLLFGFTRQAAAVGSIEPLKVVATIPDLADIAREIGGDRLSIFSIAKGRENAHAVQVRPSTLVAVNNADVFLEMGLSLEHSYVPGLLMAARNPKIQPGQPGFVNVSEGWTTIEVPNSLSREVAPDLHPNGNPHFNVDPKGGRHIATKIYEALVRIDPASKDEYQKGYDAYLKRLDEAEKRWTEIGNELKGKKIVTYHAEFNYLAASYGMEIVATIEPRPGLPPTPAHIAEVVQKMREQKVPVILTAAWSNTDEVHEVAKDTGAKVVEVPAMVHGANGADTWISMMDLIHKSIRDAFASSGGSGAK